MSSKESSGNTGLEHRNAGAGKEGFPSQEGRNENAVWDLLFVFQKEILQCEPARRECLSQTMISLVLYANLQLVSGRDRLPLSAPVLQVCPQWQSSFSVPPPSLSISLCPSLPPLLCQGEICGAITETQRSCYCSVLGFLSDELPPCPPKPWEL